MSEYNIRLNLEISRDETRQKEYGVRLEIPECSGVSYITCEGNTIVESVQLALDSAIKVILKQQEHNKQLIKFLTKGD